MKTGKNIIITFFLIAIVFQLKAQEELVFNEDFKKEVLNNLAVFQRI